MCTNCAYADKAFIQYICEYRCKLKNNETSELVDTYFNKSEQLIECPLLNQK